MRRSETLIVIPSLRAGTLPDGGFILTKKFVEGINAFVKYWPGPVRVLVACTDKTDSNLDSIAVYPKNLLFQLERLPEHEKEIKACVENGCLVLGALTDWQTSLADICSAAQVPLVYVSEYTLLTRKQIIRAETSNPILRLRREWWTTRLEQRYIDALQSCAGIQCNGMPTYQVYSESTPNPFLFFDSRTRENMLVDRETIEDRGRAMMQNEPLRLAYSGRLIAMKGVDHLPVVASELNKLNVKFTLDICGGGMLESKIRNEIANRNLGDLVRCRGILDFETELLPLMQNHVDLFMCCHRQGDPSCSYLETMACGVPIVGYDNEAFAGLSKHAAVGWPTELDDPYILAEKIRDLDRQRQQLFEAAFRSIEFAHRHTFEQTMQQRVEHLLQCAQMTRLSKTMTCSVGMPA